MTKITSTHTNPQIKPQIEHNDRTNDKSKNIYKEKTHLNECNKSAKEVIQEIDKLYNEAMEKQKGKKGKKTPKENSYKEFIYEINENTTMEQCEILTQKIAELTGFTPLQIAIHRDEGHYNKNNDFVTHYHAHAVFFTLDKNTGKQLARLQASLNPKNLSKIQDLTAEILQMQRGERRFEKKEKKQYPKDYREIKRIREREREIIDNAIETQKNAQKLKNSIELMQTQLESEKSDLKARESILITKENEIEKIQNGYEEAFNEINAKEREEKRGFLNHLKNLFTKGKHFKNITEKYNIPRKAITAQIMQKKEELKQKDKEIEKERLNAKEMQERYKKIEIENQKLKSQHTIDQELIKQGEKEALKNLDYETEAKNKDLNHLNDLQLQAFMNEREKREKARKQREIEEAKAQQKELQKSQPKTRAFFR